MSRVGAMTLEITGGLMFPKQTMKLPLPLLVSQERTISSEVFVQYCLCTGPSCICRLGHTTVQLFSISMIMLSALLFLAATCSPVLAAFGDTPDPRPSLTLRLDPSQQYSSHQVRYGACVGMASFGLPGDFVLNSGQISVSG